jgi:hypothetical protein
MTPEEAKKVNEVYAASVGLTPLPGEDIRDLISEHQRITFEQTRDPLAPWRVITWAAANDFPLPEWVIQYLRGAAQKLNDVVVQAAKTGSVKREAEAIGKALGFGHQRAGQTSLTKTTALRDRDFKIAMRVAEQIENNVKPDAAIIDVAKSLGITEAMTNRAFKEFGQQALKTLRTYVLNRELRNS